MGRPPEWTSAGDASQQRTAAERIDAATSSWNGAARRLRTLQVVQLTALIVLGLVTVIATSVVARDLGRLAVERARVDHTAARLADTTDRLLIIQVEFFRAKATAPREKALTTGVMLQVLQAGGDMRTIAADQRDWVPPAVNASAQRALASFDQLIALVQGNISTLPGSEKDHVALARLNPLSRTLVEELSAWKDGMVDVQAREASRLSDLRGQLEMRLGIIAALMGGAAVLLWVVVDRARSRVVAALRAVSEEQYAHGRITSAVTEGDDVRGVAAVATERAHTMLGALAAAACVAEHGGLPRILAAAGDGSGGLDAAMARAMATGEPAHIDAPPVRRAGDVAAPAGARCVAVPVMVDGACWGSLAVLMDGRATTESVTARLGRLAATLAVAVGNVEARRRLTDQATSDPLTDLANHRAFHERLTAELAVAAETNGPLSLVLIDIDHFKAINDGLGHQAGDQVLVEVARRLRAEARSDDLVARVGGEEFAWLMPGATTQQAFSAAERARLAVRGTRMGRVPIVTISAGIAGTDHTDRGPELVAFSDAALYWAKAHGRDLTCTWSQEVGDAVTDGAQDARLAQLKALAAIQSLARAVDARDPYTYHHSERVAEITHRLALARGWGAHDAAQLREAARMHDVGKVGVPDAVLLKPSSLTDDEYAQVKLHAALGAQIVSGVLAADQVAWVRGHHERFAGGGYPDGLVGTDIPEGARLMAVADAWDAMTSDRPYRRGCTPDEAYAVCIAERGRQLCPDAVDALTQLWDAGEMAHRSEHASVRHLSV